MRLLLYFKDAGKTILANKMRSALSTLGIIIGMASVIVMMSFGEGYKKLMMEQIWDIMKNKITISPGGGYSERNRETDTPGTYIKEIKFTPELTDYLSYHLPELSGNIAYEISDYAEMIVGTKREHISYYAVSENWMQLNEKELSMGSFFGPDHYQKKNFVTIVNNQFVEDYFKNKDPLWQKIKIKQRDFTIIWVLEKSAEEEYRSQAIAYIPTETYFERIAYKNNINTVTVFLDAEADNILWRNRITYLLLKKYNQTHKDSAGFYVGSNAEFSDQVQKISSGITTFLLVIGLISLLVGGIGVMNIMIVSVTERTREIWIRKAIGALNTDITLQFLVESIAITFIGGILALLLSYLIVFFINKLLASGAMEGMKALINFKVVLLAFGLTTLTGIVFGILPARKASKLKPIDALRFE